MTLRDYVKIFRQRWWVIVVCGLVGAVVMFVITPAKASDQAPTRSYTATATLLVGSVEGGGGASMPLGRIALYVTTGEVPVRAAQQLGFEDDPAVLAQQISVSQDPAAAALTISAKNSNAQVAADRANVFAQTTVDYFNELGSGTTLTILQAATPIADNPGGAVIPPNRALRTGLGVLVGLLLGLGVAIVIDHLDARLRTRDEIHEATDLPVIAEIPKLPRAERQAQSIVVSQSPLSVYADGYRAARSALLHAPTIPINTEPPARSGTGGTFGSWEADDTYGPVTATEAAPGGSVVMITSALAGEGKTTSAANIAASFAETGKRVLVIDADLRSPNLHELFDVPQGAGVSDFLSQPKAISLSTLVRPTSIEGVGIVTAGTQLEHPASLTSRMEPLVQAARKLADIVVIDSSPILGASDGFDIIPLVDSVLLVVRSGRLTAVAAQRVAELLKRFQVPVAGIVMVAVPAIASDGYGYGYGYGHGDSKKHRGKKTTQTVSAHAAEPDLMAQITEPTPDAAASQSRGPRRNARRAVGQNQDA